MKFNSRSIINILFFGIGITALILLIREITLEVLLDQLLSVGWAFVLILLVEFTSNIASARGWYFAFNPEERPSYGFICLTSIASLAVGGALPTGQASEIVKGNVMRGRVSNAEIVSSLIWYNYLHVLTTSSAVFIAVILPLVAGTFESRISWIFLGIALVILAISAAMMILLKMGLFRPIIRWLQKHLSGWLRPSDKVLEGAEVVDSRMKNFYNQHPGDFLRCIIWLFVGRILNVLEVWIILYQLGLPHSLPVVAMVYASTSMANYILMVLPAREGFLEGSAYLIFKMLGMDPAAGLSMEIVRRLRKIFYQLTGLILLLGMSRGPKKGLSGLLSTEELGNEEESKISG